MDVLVRTLPPGRPFLLFGLGDRPKFVFQDGALRRAPGGEPVHEWAHGAEAVLVPDAGRVELGGEPVVWEDEEGLFWRDGGAPVQSALLFHLQGDVLQRLPFVLVKPELIDDQPIPFDRLAGGEADRVAGSGLRPVLPGFAGSPHAPLLRALLREVLVNVDCGLPLPNFYVYRKPWRRDGAMMAMVLEATGNLAQLEGWARSFDDPFDRNNAGCEEPDNLGQTLYVLGLLGLGDHPLVARTVAEARRRLGLDGVLQGTTDSRSHPVYCACWLRLGLEACGLDASWVPMPDAWDDYGPLFWMRREWVGPKAASTTVEYDARYPYLWWAKAHFHRLPVPSELLAPASPLSWEQRASEARYEAIAPLSPAWASARFSAPHTWHAAEMFLYLSELG